MSHFAKIENGLVMQVIVAEQDFIDTLEGQWVQTSYNTYKNQHPENKPLRGNYAGVGYVYDATNDVFYAPQPYPSWKISAPTWTWTPPVPYPTDVGTPESPKRYTWNEETIGWDLVTTP